MDRIIHIQPALPRYRVDFFERLWNHYGDKLEVYFSPASMGALTDGVAEQPWARRLGRMRRLTHGLYWQEGATKIRFGRGDIVILSGNPRQLSTLSLLGMAPLRGAKTIWWGHYWSSTSRIWRQVIRYIPMAYADSLLFYTDLEVAEYRRTLRGLGDCRLIVGLNNGIDTGRILAKRSIFAPHDRDYALLFIGRLTRKTNLDIGLQALHALGSHAPHLHVIGDGEEGAVFRECAESLGISHQVTWYGGTTNEDRIADVANRCRAFLYPGEVGLSLVHAMAYGLPAIVHNDRWKHMPEIAAFTSGETGASFNWNDAASLAKCIDDVLGNESQLVSWSRNACQITQESFNTADMAKRFIGLVDQMM